MKILHLEDNREDAELVQAQLADEWPDCKVKIVASRAEFVEQLRDPYDVILSDFSLISFNGHEALKLAREQAPNTPFIFLSGTIGEDRAIEAVQAGAQDYVLKDRMKRLITAIKRALRESQERRKRRAAEESRERFAAILENTTDLVAMTAPEGGVLYVNRGGLRMLGWPEDTDLNGYSLPDFFPAEVARQITEEAVPAAIRDGTWSGESVLRARDGRRIPVSQVIIAHRAADGSVEYLSTTMRDLSSSKAAERRIREFVDFLNKARDAIIVIDLEGRITFWNQGAERISNWTAAEAVGHKLDELFTVPETSDGTALEEIKRQDEWRGELRLKDKQGRPFVVETSVTMIRDDEGRPKARLSICTDVTAKKSIEEQFLRAQRLESIGLLAAGIAHDLNNVLAPIMLGAPMLREHAVDPNDITLIESLERSAERGAALVRQILGFAQGASGEPRLMQIKHLMRDVSAVIRETFPKNIRYEEWIASDLWPIRGNPTQIHQVLLNLTVNARDAMPQGGTLVIRAENRTVDDLAARAIEGARPGPYVVLEVIDSGTGIAPEILAHIWEPFFTTKESGKGTGLGLPTVRGIVESHYGFITLRSEPGRGTTFAVHLPAAEGLADGDAGREAAHLPRGKGELILVVDDEARIRDISTGTLSRYGYRVLAASDGTEAVALFAQRGKEISLVITDVNMPNLDGTALARVIHRLNPGAKILAVSGMAASATSSKLAQYAGAFLLKPFKVDALLTAVHTLLHGEAKTTRT